VLEQVLPTPEDTDLKAPPGARWAALAGPDVVPGAWFDPTGGVVVELRPDGSYTALTGTAQVADLGTWTVDDSATRLSMVSAEETPGCAAGDQLVLSQLRQRDLGTLVIQADVQRDECGVLWTGHGWFLLAP
jgi:hypothetical protein